MDVAERFAQLSYAERLKVGAIVVKDDRIISIGYNGMPSGWDNVCEECCDGGGPAYSLGCYHDHCTGPKTKPEVLHAETNAIAKVAQSADSCDNAAIFCTHEPCLECAKLIMQSGIKHVYYRHSHKSLNYGSGLEFLKKSLIYVELVDVEGLS